MTRDWQQKRSSIMTDDVIVRTAQGQVRGTTEGPAARFLGIPYAESPLVTGRFSAPVPHPAWSGVRDALAHGATSAQPDRGVTIIPEPIIAGDNELNLNVYTPDPGRAGLPVLVWIHGGGFFGGCNAAPWYKGTSFARDGVVVVSINYRLGAAGFLEVPGAAANRAVLDWVRALEWVQENIGSFGGDPGRVTIAGQSAGGGACAALLAVPAARGLFGQAVCMSGGAGLFQTPDGVKGAAARFADLLGVPLRREAFEELPADALVRAQEAMTSARNDGPRDREAVARALAGNRLSWAPWTDGEVISEDPWQALRAARHSDVRLLAGATADEFSFIWAADEQVTADDVRDGLAKAGMSAAGIAAYLEAGSGSRPGAIVGQAVTDRTFRVPAQEMAAAKTAAGGAAYVYDFRWASAAAPFGGLAFHCLDIPFAFDLLGEEGVREAAGDAPPAALAAEMHGAWVRFISEGDPGWAPYNLGTRPVRVFSEASATRDDPLRAEREAWAFLAGAAG
jgi:para-nitrobenzyl esterase